MCEDPMVVFIYFPFLGDSQETVLQFTSMVECLPDKFSPDDVVMAMFVKQ